MTITPPSQWAIGSPYRVIWVCYHHDRHGIMDPTITERLVLESEADSYMASIRAANPHASCFTHKRKRHWNGGHRLVAKQ
jgi:hypothetical protein